MPYVFKWRVSAVYAQHKKCHTKRLRKLDKNSKRNKTTLYSFVYAETKKPFDTLTCFAIAIFLRVIGYAA